MAKLLALSDWHLPFYATLSWPLLKVTRSEQKLSASFLDTFEVNGRKFIRVMKHFKLWTLQLEMQIMPPPLQTSPCIHKGSHPFQRCPLSFTKDCTPCLCVVVPAVVGASFSFFPLWSVRWISSKGENSAYVIFPATSLYPTRSLSLSRTRARTYVPAYIGGDNASFVGCYTL